MEISVNRPKDLFSARVRLDGLALVAHGESLRLEAAGSGPPIVALEVGPQHLAETVLSPGAEPVGVEARLARPSWLSFAVRAADLPVPGTLDGLLGLLRNAPLRWTPGWRDRDGSWSVLELPRGLIIRPFDELVVRLLAPPVTSTSGVVDVFQAVLQRADGGSPIAFCVDTDLAPPGSGVWGADTPLVRPSGALREFLVTGTSSRESSVKAPFVAVGPIGATAELEGDWPDGPVELYGHSIAVGRDVRVMESWRGTLLPFGHRAVLLKTADRVIVDQRSPLVWRDWLIVREPVRQYESRRLPFRAVRILTEAVEVGAVDPCGFETPELHLTGTDAAAGVTPFSMALWFRPDSSPQCAAPISDPVQVRDARASGSVCFSHEPRVAATLPVRAMAWRGDATGPSLDHADVDLPAMTSFTGTTPTTSVGYAQHYIDVGLEATNPNQLVLSLTTPVAVAMNTAAAGGVATPSFAIGAVSAQTGLLPGRPEDALEAGILVTGVLDKVGVLGFKLGELLGGLGARAPAPQLSVEPSGPRWHWELDLQSHSGTVSYLGPGKLELQASTEPPTTPQDRPRTRTIGRVTGGTVAFANVLNLPIREVSFESIDGDAPHIQVDLGKVEFTGVLSAASAIADHLPEGMGGSRIDVGPTGVKATLEVNLGSIPLGVLLLQDLNLGTRFSLPLTDEAPELEFGLASRERPFHITVCGLGGGGHFAVIVSTQGVRRLEACLEFGGALALDIGVASGSVSIMGGLALAIDVSGASLMAYLRVNGSVEVLGLVRVSVLFLLQLAYDLGRDVLWGQASVRVEVEVAFFSDDVELTVHRELSVGSRSPSFTETFEAEDFVKYAEAFAL